LKVLVYCFTSSKLEAKHGELQIAKSTFEVVFFLKKNPPHVMINESPVYHSQYYSPAY
jgi:hypothetical protein